MAGRAMMRTSQPGWNEGAITLSASRSRRRTRLRTTAPPGGRASRAAACSSRARRSGCQPLSTASPTGCQDAPAPGRPHPGTEAVLLGAVALLRLIGLLHLGCPGSSPTGLGDGLSLPPEGTQTRLAPESARRVV